MNYIRQCLLDLVNEVVTCSGHAYTSFEPDFSMGSRTVTAAGEGIIAVSRSLPALAAISCSKFDVQVPGYASNVLVDIFKSAFDPSSPDWWQSPSKETADQRQVEAFFVSIAILVLYKRNESLCRRIVTPQVLAWLSDCLVVKDVPGNWDCFLQFTEFVICLVTGQPWDLAEHLRRLEKFYVGEGWFSDDSSQVVLDYYTFYVFQSYLLLLRWAFGSLPEMWEVTVQQFLHHASILFDRSGQHVLFGRSLIYRWSVLVPLVLAELQGISPMRTDNLNGLIEAQIQTAKFKGGVRGNRLTCQLPIVGKAWNEIYVDSGHPYWAMLLGFVFLDNFDVLEDAPAVISRTTGSFVTRLGIVVNDETGVRVYFRDNHAKYPELNYKYTKFVYHSRFPFCEQDNSLEVAGHTRDKIIQSTTWPFELHMTWETESHVMVNTGILVGSLGDSRHHRIMNAGNAVSVRETGYALPVTCAIKAFRIGNKSLLLLSGHDVIAAKVISGYSQITWEYASPKQVVIHLTGDTSSQYQSWHYAGPVNPHVLDVLKERGI